MDMVLFGLVSFGEAVPDQPFFFITGTSHSQRLLMFRDDKKLFMLAGITEKGAFWFPVKDNLCRRLAEKNPSIVYASITHNESIPFLFEKETAFTEIATGQWLVMPLHYLAPLS